MSQTPQTEPKLYDALIQDTNMYDPMPMYVVDGGALTVDLYDGETPLGRIIIGIVNGKVTLRQEAGEPREEVDNQ